jgi:hypothetical protein
VTEVITGHVIDGYIEGARVCIDLNANASCDGGEAQAFTDAQGAYRLEIPKDSTAPLLADVIAGRSRDLDTPQTSVDRSFHMSSPSRSYSTTITPFTTASSSGRTARPRRSPRTGWSTWGRSGTSTARPATTTCTTIGCPWGASS